MVPTYFDDEGILYSNTAYGDYPHYAPDQGELKGKFTGWMLLSYNKPVQVYSSLPEYGAEGLTDENIKTFWVAEANDDKQWIEIDLLKPSEVFALQINFNDYQAGLYGRIPNLHQRYIISGSVDGKTWTTLVDRSASDRDSPNAYIELEKPSRVRYIRYKHVDITAPYLSLSDFRVFGKGPGRPPSQVKSLNITRHEDRRDASLSWDAVKGASGYTVYWGIRPDKLYSSWQLYNQDSLLLKSLNTDQAYYFAIEAFNENGISQLSGVQHVK
jgi:hypothetical protein